MKKTRIWIALLMVLLLTVGTPLSVLAADHDVTSAEDVFNAVAADTDAEVNLNMKNDIDMGHTYFTGNAGQKYTINGNGNTISNFATDSGDITVNADMDGSTYASGDAKLTVNGDVESIKASGEAAVDITGDVTGNANNSASIYAGDNAQVSVDGNVSGHDGYIAPEDMDDPNVSVSGSNAIEAWGEAVVSVTGDVKGGDGALSDAAMKDPANYGDGGDGIFAYGNVNITVGGNVTGGDAMGTYGYSGDGIEVRDGATVTVDGNVAAGNVTADPDVDVHIQEYDDDEGNTLEEAWNSYAGAGINTDSTTTITVGGNVTGGSTNADNGVGGDAVYLRPLYGDPDAEEPAKLGSITFGGTISGGYGDADSEHGADGYDVYFDGFVGYTEELVNQLLKMETEDLLDEDGMPTDAFLHIMNLVDNGADQEEVQKFAENWMEENGYTDEDIMGWTEEEELEKELDLAQSFLAQAEIDLDAMNEYYADNFSKLSIGGYDGDPTFFSEDDESGMMAAAYMYENVKPLPTTPDDDTPTPAPGDAPLAATPVTGDTFHPVLVAGIALLALLGMGAALIIRKKRA